MKKNVIALAVAAAMAAPLAAQAEVKVSGTLQAEVVSYDSDMSAGGLYMTDGETYGNPNNGSGVGNIAFSASEDLGNGMKAIAKYAMNVTASEAYNGERDAYVGLTGGFGTVLAGRLSTPYATSTGSWDPFKATFAQARGNGGQLNGVFGNGSYLNNALAYANKFGMVKVVLAYGLDEAADTANPITGFQDSTTGNHAMAASVNIPVGPIEIAAAVLNATDYATQSGFPLPAAGNDRSQTKVGVKYTAGALTVAGTVEQSDISVTDGQYMWISASYAMGANTISASYGTFSGDNSIAFGTNVNSEAWGDGNIVTSDDATYMAVGLKHAFSKNTSAYVAYRSTNEDEDLGQLVSGDESAFGVGLRVKF